MPGAGKPSGCGDLRPGDGVAILVVFLVRVAGIFSMTATTVIVPVEAKPEMHGRVLALQTVIMSGSAAIGGPLLGRLADAIGARSITVLGGLVCLAAVGFGYLAADRRTTHGFVSAEP